MRLQLDEQFSAKELTPSRRMRVVPVRLHGVDTGGPEIEAAEFISVEIVHQTPRRRGSVRKFAR